MRFFFVIIFPPKIRKGKGKGKSLYFTAKREVYMLAIDFSVLPPAKLVPTLRPGEPEHVDFEKNLFKAFTQTTSGACMDSNPCSVDAQSATFITRPLAYILQCIKHCGA